MRRSLRSRVARFTALIASGGAMMQVGSCSFSGLTNFVSNFNPCGSILACDPLEYRFLTSGYQGPGFNPAVDPACSFPPFCAPGDDPFVGGLNGGGG
ncbi:MAG: hypothetical protein HRU75_02130 [Planctomycetia bacterium]|nr:MAG: hypothetical protein HRU75_02130 [Planctomycetia bacterium]